MASPHSSRGIIRANSEIYRDHKRSARRGVSHDAVTSVILSLDIAIREHVSEEPISKGGQGTLTDARHARR